MQQNDLEYRGQTFGEYRYADGVDKGETKIRQGGRDSLILPRYSDGVIPEVDILEDPQ